MEPSQNPPPETIPPPSEPVFTPTQSPPPSIPVQPPASMPSTVPIPPTNRPNLLKYSLVSVLTIGLIVILCIFFLNVFGSLKLTKYSTNGFSILVPKDYSKDQNSGSAVFTEKLKNGASKDTQSAVALDFAPTAFNSTIQKYLLDNLEKEYKNDLSVSVVNVGKLQDFKTERVKIDGFDAIRADGVSLDLKGKKNGKVSAVAVVGDHGIYQVVIYANNSDPGLARSTNRIINSLRIDK